MFGGPILTSCAILAEVGTIPINHSLFRGTTEMEGKDASVCLPQPPTLFIR